MTRLIDHYQEFYRDDPEARAIQDAIEPELRQLMADRDDAMDQLVLETATWGLKYWEAAVGIPTETDKDLDYRRSRVRSKLRGAGTTTVALIKSVSESFAHGKVEVREDAAHFRVYIDFVDTFGTPPNMDDLTASIREIMPAHLQWEFVYTFRKHQELKPYTHAQLAAYSHETLREGVL